MSVSASRHTFAHRALTTSVTTIAAVTCLVATSAPATAAITVFPDGEACVGFDVSLDGGDSKRNTRTFMDWDGNTVVLTTGAAERVVVTNLETGESVTAPARGVRTRATTDDNGTASLADDITTFEITGNLLLILFSSDAGGAGLTPSSTTLISGRTVFTVDAMGVFTVQSVSGKTTDICAALAP